MAGIRIRFVGGPKDGRYEDWAMQGGRPPLVIETVEMQPVSAADYWTPDFEPSVREEVTYTRCSYYRLGKRDIQGAELYVTDTVRRGLALGLSLDILGVAEVQLPQSPAPTRAHFVGGSSHGRRMTVSSPPPMTLRIPIPGEPSARFVLSVGEFIDLPVECYDNLNIRDGDGNWIYILHDYMEYVVNGRVPLIAGVMPSIHYAIQIVAARYARMAIALQRDNGERTESPPRRSRPRPGRRRDDLPNDEDWTTPAGGRGDPLAGVAPAEPWTGWNLIKEIDEVIGDGGDDAGGKQNSD